MSRFCAHEVSAIVNYYSSYALGSTAPYYSSSNQSHRCKCADSSQDHATRASLGDSSNTRLSRLKILQSTIHQRQRETSVTI